MKDGYINVCIDCKKKYQKDSKNDAKYYKTKKGVIRVIYKTQIFSSKKRNHVLPLYTKDELREWLFLNGFEKLYQNWVKSGYKKYQKPSVDRLDDYKPYSLDNIRLVTWQENEDKSHFDLKNALSKSGEQCKPVLQFDLEGNFIREFISHNEAQRQTNIFQIYNVCNGKNKTAGGFKLEYKVKLCK